MPSKVPQTVNPDIEKERRSCTFDVEEFAAWWHGGVEKLREKRELEKLLLDDPELQDEVPAHCLSYQDMYNNSIKKLWIVSKKLKKLQKERNPGGNDFFPELLTKLPVLTHGNPIILHSRIFIPALQTQGTKEQLAKWLPKAMNLEIIGTYAQTELGHGTFVRGLETRADYDPKTEEFILNSPTLTSYKWWPGGIGHTANHAVVVAQLYINHKPYGVQMFVVQIRDEETHMPLPGIDIGEVGGQMALQTANNGYVGFKNYRIPRMNMLMKNNQVLPDGTFKTSPMSVLTYLTMMKARVDISSHSAYFTLVAATIATRYSAVRRQSVINPKDGEHQIIDHRTQQMKLFPEIAKGIILQLISDKMFEVFAEVSREISQQKYDRLPEMHALSCCMKAVTTKDSKNAADTLRLACGGHGSLLSSNLPNIYCMAAAALTYEGENTILLLQTARFLMKAWASALRGDELSPSVKYLAVSVRSPEFGKWDASLDGMVKALQFASANKIRIAYNHLEERKKRLTVEEARDLTAIELIEAAELHGRAFIVATAFKTIRDTASQRSYRLNAVIDDIIELYLINTCLSNIGAILQFIPLTDENLTKMQFRLEDLLAKIRPNAVAIVDGFDFHQNALNSVLGAYDGNVYERMFEMAKLSPMNKVPVQKSFQLYLKPMMRSSL